MNDMDLYFCLCISHLFHFFYKELVLKSFVVFFMISHFKYS